MQNQNKGVPPNHPRSDELHRKAEMERFLATVRIYYSLFCSILLVTVIHNINTKAPLCALLLYASVVFTYGLWRYLKPTGQEGRRGLYLLTFDHLLIGVLVFLTGGLKSYFHIAHALPICGGAIRFGFRGGISGYSAALAVTAFMLFYGGSSPLFPQHFNTAAVIGTLAFIVWIMITMVEKERQFRDRMYYSSITDHLTGLYNSSYLKERVQEEIQRCQRDSGHCFTIAFLDLDNFKVVNDKYGHLIGDETLKQIAKLLQENVRRSDVLVRYGGDEFVLFMPGATKQQGENAVQRLWQAVNSSSFHLKQVKTGISGGVASFPEDGKDLDQLLDVADQRMYSEKPKTAD